MSSVRRFLQVLVRLVRTHQGRETLNELFHSFRAADEALEAGDVDRALDLLDDTPAEALLAEAFLEAGEEAEP
jgi:hypothetical protein